MMTFPIPSKPSNAVITNKDEVCVYVVGFYH
jgi:hypothetical protein